jgi:hypothetical protein
MRLKLLLSSRETLHQVKKPSPFANSGTLAGVVATFKMVK